MPEGGGLANVKNRPVILKLAGEHTQPTTHLKIGSREKEEEEEEEEEEQGGLPKRTRERS